MHNNGFLSTLFYPVSPCGCVFTSADNWYVFFVLFGDGVFCTVVTTMRTPKSTLLLEDILLTAVAAIPPMMGWIVYGREGWKKAGQRPKRQQQCDEDIAANLDQTGRFTSRIGTFGSVGGYFSRFWLLGDKWGIPLSDVAKRRRIELTF